MESAKKKLQKMGVQIPPDSPDSIRVMTWTKSNTSNVQIKGLQKVVSCPGRKRTNGDAFDPKTREGIADV
jgi:hypothetical protein